jgi:hypothetical protein
MVLVLTTLVLGTELRILQSNLLDKGVYIMEKIMLSKAKVPYYLGCTGLVTTSHCAGIFNFQEVPYYKTIQEMVKLLSRALARRHFLIKEGVPYGGLNETQDLSVRRIKTSTFSSGGGHALYAGPTQYKYRVHYGIYHITREYIHISLRKYLRKDHCFCIA